MLLEQSGSSDKMDGVIKWFLSSKFIVPDQKPGGKV